jgi:hypothetical protein
MLIGANVVKVVPRVRNLGFVLNERLTATDHFRNVCQRFYWILHSLKPQTENYLSLIFRKINDFVHRFILDHKAVNFTIFVVNFTIFYC